MTTTTTKQLFNLNIADPSWRSCLEEALNKMDPHYLRNLSHSPDWLPGQERIFSAFSLPVQQTNYVLFGESPYPRAASANGYAFWDAAVCDIWSETGLSKPVNRATSLRNIIKMLLIADDQLTANHTSQPDIANLDKTHLIKTNDEFFQNFLRHGFLLLNATPVLQPGNVRQDAQAWQPFVHYVLNFLVEKQPNVQLILFGQIANLIDKLISDHRLKKLYAEHPYNVSFITNQKVIDFFKPMHLLRNNK